MEMLHLKRAIINGTLYDVEDGSTHEHTTILWENGEIISVGQEVEVPKDAETIDVAGSYVTPGLIHSFSHIGLKEHGIRWEGDDSYEASSTIQPDLSAIDGINPHDETFALARAYGITTAHVSPGPQNVIGGKTAIIKTVGSVIDDMAIDREHGLAVSLGEVPKGAYRTLFKTPLTRMKMAFIVRDQLRQAKYNEKSEVYTEEVFQKILKKEASLYIRAHRADDITTAIRIKKEFDINVVLVHGTEAYKVTEELKDAEIPFIAGPFYTPKSREELKNVHPSTGKVIDHAEIPYTFISNATRNITLEGSLAVREGVSLQHAIHALTLGAAKILGISDRVGTIEKGKKADLVVWDGKPLGLQTNVQRTIIEGNSVYTRGEVVQ